MTAKCVTDASSRPTPRTLLQLFQKMTHFLNLFWSKFLLKNVLNDCKVCWWVDPSPASRTVCYSKLLTVRLIVYRSYNGVIKTLRAVYS